MAVWEKKDPILRFKKFLINHKGWSEENDKSLTDECTAEVEDAVKSYESLEQADAETMFKYMYYDMPWHLKEQMEEVQNLTGGGH